MWILDWNKYVSRLLFGVTALHIWRETGKQYVVFTVEVGHVSSTAIKWNIDASLHSVHIY